MDEMTCHTPLMRVMATSVVECEDVDTFPGIENRHEWARAVLVDPGVKIPIGFVAESGDFCISVTVFAVPMIQAFVPAKAASLIGVL